jgi:hypothetical protein
MRLGSLYKLFALWVPHLLGPLPVLPSYGIAVHQLQPDTMTQTERLARDRAYRVRSPLSRSLSRLRHLEDTSA